MDTNTIKNMARKHLVFFSGAIEDLSFDSLLPDNILSITSTKEDEIISAASESNVEFIEISITSITKNILDKVSKGLKKTLLVKSEQCSNVFYLREADYLKDISISHFMFAKEKKSEQQ